MRQNIKRQLGGDGTKQKSSSLSLEDLLRKGGGRSRKKTDSSLQKDPYEEFLAAHDLLMKESVVLNPKFEAIVKKLMVLEKESAQGEKKVRAKEEVQDYEMLQIKKNQVERQSMIVKHTCSLLKAVQSIPHSS